MPDPLKYSYVHVKPAVFDVFLHHLRQLVDIPSPFTSPEAVNGLIVSVKATLQRMLPNYTCLCDASGNLICSPKHVEPSEPILYLSAHADTVPAEADLWNAPFRPYPHWEDSHSIVGQGVNDCKAGLAAIVWLADLSARSYLSLKNVVLLITFKEEGPGAKTAVELARQFGKSIPAPVLGSTLLVLENTGSPIAPFVPFAFDAENSSFTIYIDGTLSQIGAAMALLDHWRLVSIYPLHHGDYNYAWKELPSSGHVCSAPAGSGSLESLLAVANDAQVICAGDGHSFATLPARVGIASSAIPKSHRSIFTKRGAFSLEDIASQLKLVDYAPAKPFAISGGFDSTTRRNLSAFGRALTQAEAEGAISICRNPGSSDATIISSSIQAEYMDLLIPFVFGPGTRSQRDVSLPRLTHGPNETFVKFSGSTNLAILLELMATCGHSCPSIPLTECEEVAAYCD
jgi:hypothetical protein